jgi:enediyne polyketide synthase
LERRVGELVPGAAPRIAVESNGKLDRRAESDRAIVAALGRNGAVHRRPDGKPEVAGPMEVSVSHAGELTLAVAGKRPLACDAELVAERSQDAWRDLLGPHRAKLASLLDQGAGTSAGAVATRVWAACECLKKAGIGDDAPLVLRQQTTDGWIVLASGDLQIATWVGPVQGASAPITMAVLVGNGASPKPNS